ncbi:MAG: hypothetical protein COA73_01635 [Candidatus Hydrogenedentota bacterium]|nr:MAG: hypothetical protein COA73_01635 [Candidatus Hydrogenedentota bacterium]
MRKHIEDPNAPAQSKPYLAVPVQVLTSAGWIVGKLHIQKGWNIVNVLEHSTDFLTMTDVILEGRPKVIPLFTLRRDAILFMKVEIRVSPPALQGPRHRVEHSVSFVLHNGSLYGKIEIPTGVRLSTYLSRHKGFLIMQDCHYRIHNPWEKRVIDHTENQLLVNPDAVIGASEAAEGIDGEKQFS